ncbi:hypothetical protein [Heyndrickxia camelliae]|uniref:Uncharacterized protein n=1 Tax=Heyndrickxia camelliae TaxID=1707093 RepID=A0A2N3LFE5_9BACI|nr:hypothetical protein [Heyndrickxia camelliae]PKR83277.1 hypothetical protein CWO92_19965 [Heyndrickxia camelliae]
MFKYKINQKITEEVKDLVSEMFLFKILLFFEFIGFSLLFTFITETFVRAKLNFLLVFIPYLSIVLLLYWITKSIRLKK